MGAELTVGSIGGGSGDLAWVNAFRIMRGWLERLRLSNDGRAEFNVSFGEWEKIPRLQAKP